MKQELKDKWIAALRSREYPQGTGWLNNAGRFCCLGVLCEVARFGKSQSDNRPELTEYWAQPGYTFRANMPTMACETVGLPIGSRAVLVAKNDEKCLNFNEIADWIEANVPTENGK